MVAGNLWLTAILMALPENWISCQRERKRERESRTHATCMQIACYVPERKTKPETEEREREACETVKKDKLLLKCARTSGLDSALGPKTSSLA